MSLLRHLGRGAMVVLVGGGVGFAVDRAEAQTDRYHLEIFESVPGVESVFPTDMTASGAIIGNAGTDPFDPLARPVAFGFGRRFELPRPTESLNFALGVGSPALIVGTSSNQPVAWVRGRATLLRPAAGLPSGFAYDANARGIIVGTVFNDLSGRQRPVVWRDADAPGFTLSGIDDSRHGVAFAINERNQVAGIVENAFGYAFIAARWDDPMNEPIVVAPFAGGINSEALALNEHGDLAGRMSFEDFSVEAMLYIESTQETLGLGFLAGRYSVAHALNDERQVVGAANAGREAAHGFIWQSGVMTDLNDLVQTSSSPFDFIANAVAIDASGRVAVEVVVDTGLGRASRIGRLVPVGQ